MKRGKGPGNDVEIIPAYLKSYSSAICENVDFQLSKDITLNLKKTFYKQFSKDFFRGN